MSNPFEINNSEVSKNKEQQESNFFLDAYNLCAKHPLETIGTAVGIAATAALAIRNPFVLTKLSRAGLLSKIEALEVGLCTKVFGATVRSEITAAERVGFAGFKPTWIKQHEREYLNGFKQTTGKVVDNFNEHHLAVENLFPDGRKLTLPMNGYLKMEHPDGSKFVLGNNGSFMSLKKPDGTFIHHTAEGSRSIHWPNENSFSIDANGARQLYLDKKLYWIKPGEVNEWRRLSEKAPPIDDQTTKALEPWLTADPVPVEFKKFLSEFLHQGQKPKLWLDHGDELPAWLLR